MKPKNDWPVDGKNHPDGLMTVREIAKRRLTCSIAFVYGLVESGELKHYRLGKGQGGIRVSEEQLQEYLRRKEKGGERAAQPSTDSGTPKLPAPRHLSLG